MKITQAVILAGGAGTRLKPFTLTNPKPLLNINNIPFLQHIIKLLKENGIKEVVILTGYLSNKIESYFKDGSKLGIKIKYSYTPFLDKTGKENKSGIRIKNAKDMLDKFFLLLYCDNYWPLNLKSLLIFFKQHQSKILVTIYSNKDNSTKNNIYVNSEGYVTKYDQQRACANLNGVNIGFFIVNKQVLNLLPNTNSIFEEEIFPKLIKNRTLSGFLTDQKYYSISDLKRAKITENFLNPKKIIFLDRDGVINKKPSKADYVKTWKEFEFLPGSIKAIKLLNDYGFKVFVISNQAGLARGILTEKGLNCIHNKMEKVLKKHGAKIDGIYYCPHGWNDGCNCRKPKPGMLFKASQQHYLDLTKAILIGDDRRDLEAGKAAGCQVLLTNKKNDLFQIVKLLIKKT